MSSRELWHVHREAQVSRRAVQHTDAAPSPAALLAWLDAAALRARCSAAASALCVRPMHRSAAVAPGSAADRPRSLLCSAWTAGPPCTPDSAAHSGIPAAGAGVGKRAQQCPVHAYACSAAMGCRTALTLMALRAKRCASAWQASMCRLGEGRCRWGRSPADAPATGASAGRAAACGCPPAAWHGAGPPSLHRSRAQGSAMSSPWRQSYPLDMHARRLRHRRADDARGLACHPLQGRQGIAAQTPGAWSAA